MTFNLKYLETHTDQLKVQFLAVSRFERFSFQQR